MDEAERAEWRARLEAMLAALGEEDALGAEGRRTVELDQQAVGRLSRMDALQGQAMAQATQARRAGQRQRIAAALERIADGSFGECIECGEAIARRRLELDPTVPTCISCARG
ncbi:MAG: TraR/DksA family transcriptional regulator [Alphaproteobacteria bacterium]|nr:MAG: TraR/DksA family transcriptional regulator [Alphaproteobacteria bacterium]